MEIKFAHLHNKFWAPNSLMVPDTPVIINDDFVDLINVVRDEAQRFKFDIFWSVPEISGEICIPGEWNYCWYNGKFYHLVKVKPNGFTADAEDLWYYYSMIYDDWQNEWLTNNFYLKGTIDLTGDPELAKEHIVQIQPLIENVNTHRTLNGVQIAGEDIIKTTTLKLPTEGEKYRLNSTLSVLDALNLNKELAKLELGTPNNERLEIPLLMRFSRAYNWKWNILMGLLKHANSGFQVFDVSIDETKGGAAQFRRNLENLLHSEELYTVASRANRVYSYTKTVNPSKFVSEVDLSNCTDVVLLDPIKLTPLYGPGNAEPRFSIRDLVYQIRSKFGWNESLQDRMMTIAEQIIGKELGSVISTAVQPSVYRNVTTEEIQRDVVVTVKNNNVTRMVKNPPYMDKDWYRWDLLKNNIADYVKSFNIKVPNRIDENGNVTYSNVSLSLNPTVNLVILTNNIKLKSDDDPYHTLDFSRNDNDLLYFWIGIIPDYDRQTHVLACSTPFNSHIFNNIRFDPADSQNQRTLPLLPFVLTEMLETNTTKKKVDWRKPSTDMLKEWYEQKGGTDPIDYRIMYNNKDAQNKDRYKTVAPARGAFLLGQGLAFWQLTANYYTRKYVPKGQTAKPWNTDYWVRYKHYWSACDRKNVCELDSWKSDTKGTDGKYHDFAYTAGESVCQTPMAPWDENKEWRDFQLEYTLPVKTDRIDFLGMLRNFQDIPDDFFRWEVINGNQKKGRIKRYHRDFYAKTEGSSPSVYRINAEMEKKIPANEMVAVWICLCPNYKAENTNDEDRDIQFSYDEPKYTDTIRERLDSLIHNINSWFFSQPWEHSVNTRGAIPVWIQNETVLYNKPKDGKRSIMALSYAKPHQGRYYIAYVKFLNPWLNSRLQFGNDPNNRYARFDPGDYDWFMSFVPSYYNMHKETWCESYNRYTPGYWFREKPTNISSNAFLSFLFGGYINKDVNYDFSNIPYKNQLPITDTNFRRLLARINTISPTYNRYSTIQLLWKNYLDYDSTLKASAWYAIYRLFLKDFNTLTLWQWINHEYETDRTDNPKEMSGRMITGSTNIEIASLDNEIPPFVIPYIKPDSVFNQVISQWHSNPGVNTDAEKLEVFEHKMKEMCRQTTNLLSATNQWIKFEGTNWYASIKLNNYGDTPTWDYELFTTEKSLIKHKDKVHWKFVNHIEKDVDVLINTHNELNIFGQRFPIKSRKHSENELLDLGVAVKALPDETQTQSAIWYAVEMYNNEQDIIRTIIETPKELVKYEGFTPYEKERLIRDINLKAEEMAYSKQLLEFQKAENKFMNEYETNMNHYAWKYGVAGAAIQMVTGAVDAVVGGVEMALGHSSLYRDYAVDNPKFNDYDHQYGYPNSPFKNYVGLFRPLQHSRLDHRNKIGTFAGIKREDRHTHFFTGNPQHRFNAWQGHRMAGGASTIAHGFGSIFQGGANIGEAYDTWYVKDQLRKDRFELAGKKLSLEGDMMNKRHEYERANLMSDIWQLSANVVYPQISNQLAYKLYNREYNISDVHLVQYYPSGKLLERIKNYYKEYGYEVMVRDVECTGIESIKRHIRYEYIYELNHPNLTIKETIRARAIMGVKVVPWKQWTDAEDEVYGKK